MSKQNSAIINLSQLDIDDVKAVHLEPQMQFYIPLPSVGVTNMHIDICWDLADASWIAEKLSAVSEGVRIEHDYSIQHKTGLLLTLDRPRHQLIELLPKCIALLSGADEEAGISDEFYESVREDASSYMEKIDDVSPKLPEIIDWYNANLVGGHYHQLRYDAPDYYQEQIKEHPERQLGFYRSAYSHAIGAECFTSPDSWLVPKGTSLDLFFEITDQRYRMSDFVAGSVFMIDGKSFIGGDGLVAYFPTNQYFKSRVCASFALLGDEENFSDPFDWHHASFTHSPFLAEFTEGRFQGKVQTCSIHQTGSLIIVDDGAFNHVLYDTAPLNPVEMKFMHKRANALAESMLETIGVGGAFQPDWSRLDDERFEQLAYDLIYMLPQFDNTTIRKLGKSRSRDGGRDIEIHELPRRNGGKPAKWIFQCKLVTDDSSLTGKRLQDIGDMLDIYDAEGFGVVTSAPIDATLYDKLDAICKKRHVSQRHFSRHELQRLLTSYSSIRKRYFP